MTLPPGWRAFSELSKKEAQQLLDAYVAGLPARAEELVEEVRRRGGPADRLDFTPESLDALWGWFIVTQRLPDQPVDEAVMRASDPPWWFDFLVPLGMELGPELAKLVTLIAAYLAATIQRARPDSRWLSGPDRRYTDFREPLLEVQGGIPRSIDSSLVIMALNALGEERLKAHSSALRETFAGALGGPRDDAAAMAAVVDGTPYAVSASDAPGFSHEVILDEVLAAEEEDRVSRFVQRLREAEASLEIVHEDRELVLINAPGLSTEALGAIVASAWQASGVTDDR